MSSDRFEEDVPRDRTWTDHRLFHGLDNTMLRTIAPYIKIRRYKPRSIVISQGDIATHLFIIRAGEVEICRDVGGRDVAIAGLRRGAIFGEMGLLTDNKRAATVVSTTALEVLAIPKETLDLLIGQNFAVARDLLELLNSRSVALEQAALAPAAPDPPTPRVSVPATPTRPPPPLPSIEHQIFTIFSPAGGTGKTTISCNLAVALAHRLPHRVVLVDLALTASQCALALNVAGKPSIAAYAAAGGLKDMHAFDALAWQSELLGQHSSSLGVLSVAHTALEAVTLTPQTIHEVLASLTALFPLVLVDTTTGYSDPTLMALRQANRVLLVSNYELTSLRAMIECVTALADADNPLEKRSTLILNNTRARPALRGSEFEARVKLPVACQLPFGDDLPSIAARDGTPVVEMRPQAPLARELAGLADRLVAIPAVTAPRR